MYVLLAPSLGRYMRSPGFGIPGSLRVFVRSYCTTIARLCQLEIALCQLHTAPAPPPSQQHRLHGLGLGVRSPPPLYAPPTTRYARTPPVRAPRASRAARTAARGTARTRAAPQAPTGSGSVNSSAGTPTAIHRLGDSQSIGWCHIAQAAFAGSLNSGRSWQIGVVTRSRFSSRIL